MFGDSYHKNQDDMAAGANQTSDLSTSYQASGSQSPGIGAAKPLDGSFMPSAMPSTVIQSAPPLNDTLMSAMPQPPALVDIPSSAGPNKPKTDLSENHSTAPAVAAPATPPPPPANEDELLQIKNHALQSLGPLVGQLDQPAEDRFKTVMMLIQASDNPELIGDAYAAANQITDERVRAQALLDVVNEINYFTQHPGNNAK